MLILQIFHDLIRVLYDYDESVLNSSVFTPGNQEETPSHMYR
jgi:hypothetical protein